MNRGRSTDIRVWITLWLPFFFCLFLSALYHCTVIREGTPPCACADFVTWLPMAFFFVGVGTTHLRKEIQEILRRLEEHQREEASD